MAENTNLGKINAIRRMIDVITDQCKRYEECKKLAGMTNKTMDDLVNYRLQLKTELERLGGTIEF